MNELSNIAARINAEHEAAQHAKNEAIAHALKAGELLLEAKQRAAHGQWLPWLKTHVKFSERTAQAYMRLTRELPKLDGAKAQRVADMPLRDALALLVDKKPDQSLNWGFDNNWLPKNGMAAMAFVSVAHGDLCFSIRESDEHPGYYFASFAEFPHNEVGGFYEGMRKPASAEGFMRYGFGNTWATRVGTTFAELPWVPCVPSELPISYDNPRAAP